MRTLKRVVEGTSAPLAMTVTAGQAEIDFPSSRLRDGDLDVAVERVKQAMAAAHVSGWAFGRAILDIFDAQLWKLRTDDGAPQRYRTWEAFCLAELGITRRHASGLVEIARRYPSEVAKEVSATALGVLAALPPGDAHDRLLDKAKQGAPVSALRSEVQSLRPPRATPVGKRAQSAESLRAEIAASEAAKDKAAAGDTITVASILRKPARVPLHLADGTQANARTRGSALDGAHAAIDLLNGTTMHVTVRDARGRIELEWEVRREAQS